MRSFLTREHLCIQESGGPTKDSVHKKGSSVKKKKKTIWAQ
jgi:hypothetical protein